MRPFAFLSLFLLAQTNPPTISPETAGQHRGRIVTVCGVVEAVSCSKGERVLRFPSEWKFRIVVPTAAERRLEERFVDRKVCATGRIEFGGKGQQIVISSPGNITVAGNSYRRVFASHAYRATCEPGLTLPKLIKEVKPQYTLLAMRANAQGAVWMDVVVEDDGRVGDAWVTRSLRNDLDQQAVLAVKEWRFEPGTLDGQPVAVLVAIEMTFQLRGK